MVETRALVASLCIVCQLALPGLSAASAAVRRVFPKTKLTREDRKALRKHRRKLQKIRAIKLDMRISGNQRLFPRGQIMGRISSSLRAAGFTAAQAEADAVVLVSYEERSGRTYVGSKGIRVRGISATVKLSLTHERLGTLLSIRIDASYNPDLFMFMTYMEGEDPQAVIYRRVAAAIDENVYFKYFGGILSAALFQRSMTEALTPALAEESPRTVIQAAELLGEWHERDATGPLRAALARWRKHEEVKKAIKHAFKRLGLRLRPLPVGRPPTPRKRKGSARGQKR